MNKEKQKLALSVVERVVPELRFPEFENDEEWKIEPLNEVYSFKITNSFSRDKLNYEKGKVKNIHYGDIHTKFSTHFDILKESVPYINLDTSIERIDKDNYCKEGDLVIADASEDIDDIGKSIEIINLNKEKLLAGLHTFLARPIDSKITIGFGGHLFKSNGIRAQIKKEAQGTKVLGISKGRLANLYVHYPENPKEQQKIANFLSSLDKVISAETEKLDVLQNHKKGLLQQLFPAEGETKPQFRFPEFENDGDWNNITIQKLIDNKTIVSHLDGNHGALYPKSEEFATQGIPYVTANDFVNGIVDFKRCKRLPLQRAKKFKKGVAKNGDILFAHNATVGPVAKLETELEFVILSTTATYFRCDNKNLYNNFLLQFLISPNFVKQYTSVMSQSTRNQVPITTQRKFYLSLPKNPKEQQKIANCLSSVDDLIIAQIEKIKGLKKHKKGLMQQLFPILNDLAI